MLFGPGLLKLAGGGRGAYIKKFLRVFLLFLGPPKGGGGPNRNIGYI